MSTHLTPLDATFLELEQADPGAHMHIGGVLVFDALPIGGPPLLEELLVLLDERLDALPRYRQRLSSRTTGGLRWPAWVDDDRFDLLAHVRRASLPAPGREQELLDWAADFYAHRLDRDRPLWEMVLLEGLEDGRWALATKTHHCLVDGVGSVDVATVLLDAAPDPAGTVWSPPPAPAEPSRIGQLATLPLKAVRAGLGAATHPARALEHARGVAELLARNEVVAAPRSSLNVPIGKERRLVALDVPLSDVTAVRAAHGGTVNDIVLTMVTGGLRRLLLDRGERPPGRGLRAMVPVNVRAAAEHMGLGNHISSLFVDLPVAAPDAPARLRMVRQRSAELKAHDQARAGLDLVELAGLAPPVAHAALARALFATRLFNVTVTNVPGPQMPLFALGARLRRVIPLVPLAADHAVAVAVFSYDGTLTFCVHADRDAMVDVELITDGLRSELEELRAAAGAASP